MNKAYFLLFVMSWCFAASTIYGQEHCATTYEPSKVSQETRESVENFFNHVAITTESPENQDMALNYFGSNSLVLIPVVVHVVFNTAAENITDAQICSQIDILNQDFARKNADRIHLMV